MDRCSSEPFVRNRQTRPFTIASPGAYPEYRLVLDGASTPAEVELSA